MTYRQANHLIVVMMVAIVCAALVGVKLGMELKTDQIKKAPAPAPTEQRTITLPPREVDLCKLCKCPEKN